MSANDLRVEDRLNTMRQRSALLWAHLFAISEQDASQFRHRSIEEAYVGLADVADALHTDICAVCNALDYRAQALPAEEEDR